jgi:glycosyltransferase involved in cell wall biosynthesis
VNELVHVAVDAHNLPDDDRGIGRYARSLLVRALRKPGFRWTFVVRGLRPRRAAMSRALGGAPVNVAHAVPRDVDVVWFPWNGTFLQTEAPSVATIHDATPFRYPARDARVRENEQVPFLRTAATAKRIFVQSEFTASEVVRWLGVERERIVVTPLAVEKTFAPGWCDRAALPGGLGAMRYILHVGSHDVRKNSATLLAAYERAFPEGDVALAFTRKPPERLPKGALVVDAPDDETLVELYRGATLVAVPSISEGFGFPMLEALACGATVVASRAGALPVVGGDAVAWVDDPLDVEGWSNSLRSLIDDDAERGRLAALGPVRAAEFSWDRCTDQTLAVLRDVARAPR